MTNDNDRNQPAGKPWHDPDVLHKLYHEERLSQTQIAERLGCHRTTVHRAMVEHDVPRRETGMDVASFRTRPDGYEEWYVYIDGEQANLRVNRLLAIACGEDPHAVLSGDIHIHHKNGVKWDNRPDNLEGMTHSDHSTLHNTEKWGDKPWRDKELMEELHLEEGLNGPEIAEELGCNSTTVTTWLHRHGIGVRDYRNEDTPWRDEHTLRELYKERGLSIPDIAEELDCSEYAVWSWLDKFDISRRRPGP